MGHSIGYCSLAELGGSPQTLIYMRGWLQTWLAFYLAIKNFRGVSHVEEIQDGLAKAAEETFSRHKEGMAAHVYTVSWRFGVQTSSLHPFVLIRSPAANTL